MYLFNIDGLGALNAINFHDTGLKIFIGHRAAVLDPGLIGVDGIDRIAEDLGDLVIVADAHPDKSEDAQIHIEQLILL